MRIIVFIIAGLLVLFGGGCLLTLGGVALFDGASFINDIGLFISIGLPLGVLPLGLGLWLMRWRKRYDLRKQAEKDEAAG